MRNQRDRARKEAEVTWPDAAEGGRELGACELRLSYQQVVVNFEREISREGVQRAERVHGAMGGLEVRQGWGMDAALFGKQGKSSHREKAWTNLRGHLETICK